MSIVALPFNAGPETSHALARQISNFAYDILRNRAELELNVANILAPIEESQNPRMVAVNPAEVLNEGQIISQLMQQAQAQTAVDGLLEEKDGTFNVTVRKFAENEEVPLETEVVSFQRQEALQGIRKVIQHLAGFLDAKLPENTNQDEDLFGTTSGSQFLSFLEAFDMLHYIDRANGLVVPNLNVQPALDGLIGCIQADSDWEGPYVVLLQLIRACANYRIGDFGALEQAMEKVNSLVPNDARGLFAAGELYHAVQNLQKASECYEKAAMANPGEPALYTRLGLVQAQQGMPANAERNFRKAIEMEGDDKPTIDFLADLLQNTNRGHEVPGLYRSLIDQNPQHAQAHAKYAIALANSGREDEAVKAFDTGLETVEDNTIIKRYYAPLLVKREDVDRALDFYEDCLDVAPNDVPLLMEYAQTLQVAKRDFEIPRVLNSILQANPDQNTRARVLAWLIDLEQPKRVEAVVNARAKVESGDFEGALRELKPLRNWLGDYWEMWLLTAHCHNRLEEYPEAEEAATKLLNLFPGCEPAWAELSASLSNQDRHEEAYNALRQALNMLPNSLPTVFNYALAAKRAGHDEEAQSLAKQLREVVGQDEQFKALFAELEA